MKLPSDNWVHMHVWHRIEHLLNHALVVQVKDFVKLPLGAAVPMSGVSLEIMIKCT